MSYKIEAHSQIDRQKDRQTDKMTERIERKELKIRSKKIMRF